MDAELTLIARKGGGQRTIVVRSDEALRHLSDAAESTANAVSPLMGQARADSETVKDLQAVDELLKILVGR